MSLNIHSTTAGFTQSEKAAVEVHCGALIDNNAQAGDWVSYDDRRQALHGYWVATCVAQSTDAHALCSAQAASITVTVTTN
jgi:hypothetical protein